MAGPGRRSSSHAPSTLSGFCVCTYICTEYHFLHGGADEARDTVQQHRHNRATYGIGYPAFKSRGPLTPSLQEHGQSSSQHAPTARPLASCHLHLHLYFPCSCHVSVSMHMLPASAATWSWFCLSWIDCMHIFGRMQNGPKQKSGLGKRFFSSFFFFLFLFLISSQCHAAFSFGYKNHNVYSITDHQSMHMYVLRFAPII